MRDVYRDLFAYLILGISSSALLAQSSASAATSVDSSTETGGTVRLEQKLEAISSALVVTHQKLDQSQQEIRQLQEELVEIKRQLALAQSPLTESSDTGTNDTAKKTVAAIEDIQERQTTLEQQVKLHEQTKVETGSKYPVRITGLILFNSFINRGVVDNIDLPGVALTRNNRTPSSSAGGSFRQTILGLEGFGPKVLGGRTSADVRLDFFGGLSYGLATSAGIVRMRTARIRMDWENNFIEAGMVAPLISPLSPTSYATVAEPGLAGAGNLWIWSPQLRFAHRIQLKSEGRLQLEVGLLDPAGAGYSTNQSFRVANPSENSGQPAYESRISYASSEDEHALQIGLSGYYGRQDYAFGSTVNSWAGTVDWRIPLSRRFEASGEGYRGRALGGLGGGVYKNALYGSNPATGAFSYLGLNTIGGWTQFKGRFGQSIEANASIGLDDGFAADFHSLVLPANATATQLVARNKMVTGNIIFRPKTYLIMSPEYRQIWTSPIVGQTNLAKIFTLSAGYQF